MYLFCPVFVLYIMYFTPLPTFHFTDQLNRVIWVNIVTKNTVNLFCMFLLIASGRNGGVHSDYYPNKDFSLNLARQWQFKR